MNLAIFYKDVDLTEEEVRALPLSQIYSGFESLGNNCEFGIVQRLAGYDPPQLFRNVGFQDIEQMSRIILNDFKGMFEEGNYRLSLPDGWSDWKFECAVSGISLHSGISGSVKPGSEGWLKATSTLITTFKFLSSKLQEDLAEGRKIFVFRTLQNVTDEALERLRDSVQLRGPSALLYVSEDSSTRSGSAEFCGGGLIKASLQHLSNENPPQIDYAGWEALARQLLLAKRSIWAQSSINASYPRAGASLKREVSIGRDEIERSKSASDHCDPSPERISMTAHAPKTDEDLVKRFESLGDNCEFGLIQRYAGAEPLGLFRFNFTRMDSLLLGLETGFSDLAAPGNLSVEWQNEWFVREKRFDFAYHTFNTDQSLNISKLIREHSDYLKFLAEDFLSRLADGQRIYVRKGDIEADEPSMWRLVRALRLRGPAVVLWVCETSDPKRLGTVRQLGDGLLQGWIRRFAPYDDAVKADPLAWLPLLRAAWVMTHPDQAPAMDQFRKQTLIPSDFGGWTGSDAATSEFTWNIVPPHPNMTVMKHVLLRECGVRDSIFGCLVDKNIEVGDHYVASTYLYISDGFIGINAGLVLLGCDTEASSTVNLRLIGVWQRIWVCARVRKDRGVAFPRLFVHGPTGTTIYTSGWRLERGRLPTLEV